MSTSTDTSESIFDSNRVLNLSGMLVTAVVGIVGTYTMEGTGVFLPVAIFAAAQFVLFVLFGREQRHERLRTYFWLEALCIAVLLFLVPSSFMAVLTMVWLVQSVELNGTRQTVPYMLASLSYFIVMQFVHYGFEEWVSVLVSFFLYGLLQLFAVSVVTRANRERDQREQIAAMNRELIATRELLSQSSAQSERLRIARDLHDILGHHMTALILNLEIASHSVEGQPKEKVEQSLALAKLLLTDLRNTVSELRDESGINLEDSIRKLIAGIPDFAFELDFTAAPDIADVDSAETFLRCAQEAVTNVLRHSDASRCQIIMAGDEESCTLTIKDNGSGVADIEPGNGLKGMQERVQAKGGELAWQQDAQGFQLRITLAAGSAT